MKTYNGINVPMQIKPSRIISAFQNEMDCEKVEDYTNIMKAEMLSHNFPAISGFPVVLDEDDIGQEFLNGEEITEDHIGMLCWKVTDGHHRAISAINANLPYLEVDLDYSTITNEQDFKNFNN